MHGNICLLVFFLIRSCWTGITSCALRLKWPMTSRQGRCRPYLVRYCCPKEAGMRAAGSSMCQLHV